MTSTRLILPAMLISMLVAAVTSAQTQPDPASPQPDNLPTAPQILAQRLTLLARQSLATADQSQPISAQITQARILLHQANTLDDSDAQRWLLTAEAADLADDADGRIDSLKQYMRLAPQDDVAQLLLIDLLTAKMQTADQRLAYFLKIAEGPLAPRFTAALRSRVAFRAAILAAAQAQPEEYGRLLTLALQLDSTNKAAAAESLRVLSSSPDATATERAAAMLTLFHADPTDPRTHAAIGDMLMGLAQYGDAVEWFAQAAQIENADRRPASISLLHQWALSLWGDGRATDAVNLLAQLDPPAPASAQGGGTSVPPQSPDSDKPASASAADWPPLDSLMLRAAILAHNGSEADLSVAFNRLNDRFLAQLKTSPDSPATLASQAWAQLLCNQSTDQTSAILDKLAAHPDAAAMQLPLLRGWLAMRTGNKPQALQLLQPLAENDPRATLALALLAEGDGTDLAVKSFRRVVLQSPVDIFGMIASSRLRRASLPLPQPSDSQSIAAVFAAVPSSLRQMFSDPMRFVQVRLTCPTLRFDFGQRIPATLEVRNVSNYPLSMEAGGPIPNRLILLPTATIDLRERPKLPPLIVNVDRRLRLDPLRSMSFPIFLDSGSLGAVLSAAPWQRIQIDVTAILNPTLNPAGAFTPGMLGSASSIRNLVRRNTTVTPQAIDQKIVELASSDPAASMRAIAMVLALLPHEEPAPDEQKRVADSVVAALAAAWPKYSTHQQAYLIAMMPPSDFVSRQLAPLLTEAARSSQPLVQLMLLASQVRKADDPILNAALRNSDPVVRDFAQAARTVLEQPKPQPDIAPAP